MGKIETLEDTTQKLQRKLEKLESQYEALRQLLNDADTRKTLIKTTQREKDIQTLQMNVTR